MFRYVGKDCKNVIYKKVYAKKSGVQLAKTHTEKLSTRQIMLMGIDDQCSAYSMGMVKFANNDKVYMFFVIIDVLLKYLSLLPVSHKRVIYVANTLWKVLPEGRVSKRIQTDKRQEL